MNTLTWNIKPFALPRVNANLISVISLIVFCMIGFLLIQPVFAYHCTTEHIAVFFAPQAVELANAAVEYAEQVVADAEGLELITALVALAAANYALNKAEAAHDSALEDLQNCLGEHDQCPCGCGDPDDACTCDDEEDSSGGCDSSVSNTCANSN